MLSGLFETVKELFGCEILKEQENTAEILWEQSVQVFKVVSEGQVTGYFFLTFSPGKKNAEVHGWMNVDQESNTIRGSNPNCANEL